MDNPEATTIDIETEDEADDSIIMKCGEIFCQPNHEGIVIFCWLCDEKFMMINIFIEHLKTHEQPKNGIELTKQKTNEIPGNENKIPEDNFDTEIQDKAISLDPWHSYDDSADENWFYSVPDDNLNINDTCINGDDSLSELLTLIESSPQKDPTTNGLNIITSPEISTDQTDQEQNNIIEEITDNELFSDVIAQTDEEILNSKLTCKFCNNSFDFVKDLQNHDCYVIPPRTAMHKCDVCQKIFSRSRNLYIHKLSHSNVKPHVCNLCGSSFRLKHNLEVHVRRHNNEKPFKCDHCDKSFVTSTEKSSHTRLHTGEKNFVCELCGRSHSSSSQLQAHKNLHLDIRSHKCTYCEKKFRSSYSLRKHMQIHFDTPRTFQCQHCEAAFKTKNSLDQHIRIHDTNKRYTCKICSKSFAQHSGLFNHMKTHTISK